MKQPRYLYIGGIVSVRHVAWWQKRLYIGYLEHKSSTSFLIEDSIIEISEFEDDKVLIIVDIFSPINLN